VNSQPYDPDAQNEAAAPGSAGQAPSPASEQPQSQPPQPPQYQAPQPPMGQPPQYEQPQYQQPANPYEAAPQQPMGEGHYQQPMGQPPMGQQQYQQAPQEAQQAPAKGGWRSKLKAAAETAVAQGKQAADKAKTAAAEQGAKRTAAWAEDPNTLWVGESKDMATKGLGVSKARYRITKDRIQIESGMLGTKSESVPLWSVKDMDVRQAVWQRGNDVGDVVLTLEDPAYAASQADMFSMSGASDPGAATGQVVLDNIEHPHSVIDLLTPLVSEARHKKTIERQSTYMHVNPGMAAMGMAPQAPPAQPAPAAEPPAPAGPSLAAQLRELAELRDAGVLTPEEFDAQKTRLLNSQS